MFESKEASFTVTSHIFSLYDSTMSLLSLGYSPSSVRRFAHSQAMTDGQDKRVVAFKVEIEVLKISGELSFSINSKDLVAQWLDDEDALLHSITKK
jgi:hypothetical protein